MAQPTLFLTYARSDNQDNDVEFIRTSLEPELNVVLDYVLLNPGQPMVPQLEDAILSCDAWAMFVSTRSLASKNCREELLWAFNRAMQAKGEFPLIGLVKGGTRPETLPSALQVRLWISLDDPDWKDRLVNAVLGRSPPPHGAPVKPYKIRWHELGRDAHGVVMEVRPRLATWHELWVEIPRSTAQTESPYSAVGVPDEIPTTSEKLVRRDSATADCYKLYVKGRIDETQSLYVIIPFHPELVRFGTSADLAFDERPS